MRDNFTRTQKQATLDACALEVRDRWRHEPDLQSGIFYICANCRFVSANRHHFEVDHIVSCKEGGTANKESLERVAAIERELQLPLDRLNVALIMSANSNDQVLCVGCNQGKKSNGHAPDLIPEGCGYAYRLHGEDRNPDHLYAGAPRAVGYVHPRYR